MPSWAFAGLSAVGCALLGLMWAASLSRRAAALTGWARALARLEAMLGLRTPSLSAMLARAAEGEENRDVRQTLLRCSERMEQDALATLASVMAREPLSELTQADRAALSPLWNGLGAGEEGAQRGMIASVRMALAAQIAQAAEREQRDRRLALSLGIIGGGVVFLFLL